MAKILSDREIKKLLQTDIIVGAAESCVNPNGISLRVGKHVRFISTKEDKELAPGKYLRVIPGETVLIASLENIDFRAETVQKHYENCGLMAWISPITDMMREGIAQVTSKIDSGYRGNLNWSLRNNSNTDLLLAYGQPLYKLTIYRLEGEEKPDVEYGKRADHVYQGTDGIKSSARQIPADLSEANVVSSSLEKLDPQKQLRQAGYPFNHMATELAELHSGFGGLERQTKELAQQIEMKTGSLSEKIDRTEKSMLEKIRETFRENFIQAIGTIVGALALMLGGISFLNKSDIGNTGIGVIAVAVALLVFFVTHLLTKRSRG